MKTLSIRQPWAWLITNGHKDIENRTWSTSHRGGFLVHAGQTVDKQYWEIRKQVASEFGIEIPDWQDLPTGGIVGYSEIVDCVEESDSPWWQNKSRYGFKLANSTPCELIPCPGKLSFFESPVEIPKS